MNTIYIYNHGRSWRGVRSLVETRGAFNVLYVMSCKRIRSGLDQSSKRIHVVWVIRAWYDITKGGRIKERDAENAFRIVRKVEEVCSQKRAKRERVWPSRGRMGAREERKTKIPYTVNARKKHTRRHTHTPSSEREREREEEDKTKATDPYSHSEDLRFAYGESLYETKRQHFLEEKSSPPQSTANRD